MTQEDKIRDIDRTIELDREMIEEIKELQEIVRRRKRNRNIALTFAFLFVAITSLILFL